VYCEKCYKNALDNALTEFLNLGDMMIHITMVLIIPWN